jgi:hypothetical protein
MTAKKNTPAWVAAQARRNSQIPDGRHNTINPIQAEHDRERKARDMAMLLDPDKWPRWPLLPVKHRRLLDWDKPDAFGFVVDDDALHSKWRVYIGLAWSGSIMRAVESATYIEYETPQALLEVYTVD